MDCQLLCRLVHWLTWSLSVMSLLLLWIILITRVVGREHRFGTGIAYGTIPSGFPIFWVNVPGCPGTATEQVRPCGFMRNSSNLDKAPKIQDSVLPNSWDSFWVILPWISSKTCVIYSSVFPKVVMILKEKFCQLWRLNWIFNSITKANVSSCYEGKVWIKANT